MQFLVTGHDGNDAEALNRRLAARQAHLALGKTMKEKGQLLYAAALLDETEKMVGSVLIVDFSSRGELDAWLETEPYVTGRVWEKVDIQLCRVGPTFAK